MNALLATKPLRTLKILGHKESESEVAQLCLTVCDPIDYSLPGSSIHGIFQARILESVAISFSKGTRVFSYIVMIDYIKFPNIEPFIHLLIQPITKNVSYIEKILVIKGLDVQTTGSQNVVARPVASVSPGNSLKTQTFGTPPPLCPRPAHRPLESETPG